MEIIVATYVISQLVIWRWIIVSHTVEKEGIVYMETY